MQIFKKKITVQVFVSDSDRNGDDDVDGDPNGDGNDTKDERPLCSTFLSEPKVTSEGISFPFITNAGKTSRCNDIIVNDLPFLRLDIYPPTHSHS